MQTSTIGGHRQKHDSCIPVPPGAVLRHMFRRTELNNQTLTSDRKDSALLYYTQV
jgi:hypothetical protein